MPYEHEEQQRQFAAFKRELAEQSPKSADGKPVETKHLVVGSLEDVEALRGEMPDDVLDKIKKDIQFSLGQIRALKVRVRARLLREAMGGFGKGAE